MKISFKDVGQGDSIVIEWKDELGVEKIGIVDCNLRGKTNPILDYLKLCNYTEIAFIILSHPHSDHYSGLLELLEYADSTDILIRRMGHTLAFNGVESYWKYFEVNTNDTNLLSSIKSKWFSMFSRERILRMDALIDGKEMRIDNELKVIALAPSHADILQYLDKVKLDEVKNVKDASRAANLLSTLLKISYQSYNYLLTSDTENVVFLTALQNERHHFQGINFHVCQMAHHGSSKNYTADFWNSIVKFEIQNAVASAGSGYNHPSVTVLNAFSSDGFRVYCTNIVNGMKDFVNNIDKKSKSLDPFSKLAEEYTKANDRTFTVQEGSVVLS